MTDVKQAQATVDKLQARREATARRAQEIAEQRRALGFKVHADDDSAARKQLDKLNTEDATIVGELQSLDAAIVEGQRRLATKSALMKAQAAAMIPVRSDC